MGGVLEADRCVFCAEQVAGVLGPVAKMDKKGLNVSDQPVGLGGTTMWKMCSLDTHSTVAALFDIVGSREAAETATSPGSNFYVQFSTKYLHYSGELRCRVSTIARRCEHRGFRHAVGWVIHASIGSSDRLFSKRSNLLYKDTV